MALYPSSEGAQLQIEYALGRNQPVPPRVVGKCYSTCILISYKFNSFRNGLPIGGLFLFLVAIWGIVCYNKFVFDYMKFHISIRLNGVLNHRQTGSHSVCLFYFIKSTCFFCFFVILYMYTSKRRL